MNKSMQIRLLRAKLLCTYFLSKQKKQVDTDQKTHVIVALAADYGNLGDVAITFAQKRFLEKLFPERAVVLFPISATFSRMKELKSLVCKDDIITVVGGGNMGDLYDDIEFCRQFVIRMFKKNRIVLFPQTIDYSDTVEGQKTLRHDAQIYGKHRNLTIFVREEVSYQKYKDSFRNEVYLVPDIVMGFRPDIRKTDTRRGALLCLRTDKERALTDEDQKRIIELISSRFTVVRADTQVKNATRDLNQLRKMLFELLNRIASSEIVVTDRLHCMIFCYITETPCIVLSGSNHKVRGCYQWIQDAPFIRLIEAEHVDHLMETVSEVCRKSESRIKKISYSESYQSLRRALTGEACQQ